MKHGPIAQLAHDMAYNASTRRCHQQQQRFQDLHQPTIHISIKTMTKVPSMPCTKVMPYPKNIHLLPCSSCASCTNGTPRCRNHSLRHGSSGNARPRSLLSSIDMFSTRFSVWLLYTHIVGSLSNGLLWKVVWHRQPGSRLRHKSLDPPMATRITSHGTCLARQRPRRPRVCVQDSKWTTSPWSNSAAKCFVWPVSTSTEH